MSPQNQNSPFDGAPSNFSADRNGARQEASNNNSAILIRRLPKTLGLDALRSMLVFAKDLVNAEFVTTGSEDMGFKTAVARFKSASAAHEARAMLDGKRNTTGDANMIVNILPLSPGGSIISRRNTFEPRSPDALSGTRSSSKFNGTFQALDHMSPTRSPNFNQEPPQTDPYGAFLSQQHSVGSPLERQPRSGKSVIGEDGVDDETGNILKDPVAYAKNDMTAANIQSQTRRPTLPQIPTARFSNLSINSSSNSPAMSGMTSPRGPPIQSPTAFSPPGMNGMSSSSGYPMSPPFMRNTMPPVNPADQNPPCNTLYVGNLPIDTSEDELKMIFSKQRGYKRLCFRTKANGPMCFVEFEDISFATKALQGLYGHMLSNSVKGGIRLSFSKNPLGVRSGQHNGMTSPMSPHGSIAGMNGYGGVQSFAAANGPPPGLAMPPGLNNSMAHMQNGLSSFHGSNNASPNGALGSPLNHAMSPIGTNGTSVRSPIAGPGSTTWNVPNGIHPDYLYGR